MVQVCLFIESCSCGSLAVKAGKCVRCYAKQWHNLRRFGGHREQVLERDDWQCRACQAKDWLIVHHRMEVEDPAWMITLCAGCHDLRQRSALY